MAFQVIIGSKCYVFLESEQTIWLFNGKYHRYYKRITTLPYPKIKTDYNVRLLSDIGDRSKEVKADRNIIINWLMENGFLTDKEAVAEYL